MALIGPATDLWAIVERGKTINALARTGFRTHLFQRALERELSGELHMACQPDRLKAQLSVRLDKFESMALI